jgi:hypothetical protein
MGSLHCVDQRGITFETMRRPVAHLIEEIVERYAEDQNL